MSLASHFLETDENTPPIHTDIFHSLINLGSTTTRLVPGGRLLYFDLPPQGEGASLVPGALPPASMLAVRTINALVASPIGGD
jgi:hypothetical protein